jgi:hypothetical protein
MPKVCEQISWHHDKPAAKQECCRLGSVKISVIYFGGSLRDMNATSNPDLRDTKPAVVAISSITDFASARWWDDSSLAELRPLPSLESKTVDLTPVGDSGISRYPFPC